MWICYNQERKGWCGVKILTDKQICIMTLALHLIFLIALKLLIYNYQDGLLVFTLSAILLYLICLLWCYRGRVIPGKVVLLYILCVAIQAILTAGFGWIYPHPYVTYLGDLNALDFGSGLGILFYGVILMISCVILLALDVMKRIINKFR